MIEVPPERLERWVENFAGRHEGVVDRVDDPLGGRIVVRGGDGVVARGERLVLDPLGLILIRRGGYAVGLASGSDLLSHKCGTRYVQSRTAAGGWSQQRFARRRGNQADALVEAVAGHAARLLCPPAGERADALRALVVGGDKALVASLLDEPVIRPLVGLPRHALHDLADPNLAVLRATLGRARSWRFELDGP
ncbi:MULTISPECIES: acVLRF1 family peptidyl-tRNA hydrolase [unclassified Janibacter]|uniref:acVLRF1 family peptidyl-tRNA hydrolase n=1 Tax=unclassified Janibacter TaxID=2649294 RepID=UPI003CFF9396